MIRYFFKNLAAQLRTAPSLYLLSLFGVSLGVASVLAIQLINRNAVNAFQGSLRSVTGETDLLVEGTTPTIPETLLPVVLGTGGVEAAWPLHEAPVALSDGSGILLQVVGFDLSLPTPVITGAGDVSFEDILGTPGWITVSKFLAEQMDWRVGTVLNASAGSRQLQLTVGAIVDYQRISPHANSRVAVMDLAQFQHLLGLRGEIRRIGVRVAVGENLQAVRRRLKDRLGGSVQILSPGQEEGRTESLLEAFRLNLTALSLISILVGVFLVFSSTQASLVRRRREFGLLRSLGATPGQVFRLILAEISLLGAIGVVIGIPLGYWAAKSQLDTVNSTLTNIYLLSAIEKVEIPSWLYLVAASVGFGSALLGALLPALDMSRRDPIGLMAAFTLREKLSRSAGPLLSIGLALLGVAAMVCWKVGFDWKPAGFILGIALLVALPLTAPFTILQLCGRFRVRGFGLSYSVRSLSDRVQTTAFAVASLGTAVTMLVGITIMIGSFRETVAVWATNSIIADIYITSESWRSAGSLATLEDRMVGVFREQPGVEAVDRIRTFPLYLQDQRVLISGVDLNSTRGESRYPLLWGERLEAYAKLRTGRGVFISEPLARKRRLAVGDNLTLPLWKGSADLPIVGITYDYTTESGLVIMKMSTMEEWFGKEEVNSLALYLEPGRNSAMFADGLRRHFGDQPIRVITSAELRANVLRIFDQTFAVVRILQLMSLLIAVSGVTLTLIILARERISELALYRALGAEARQVFKIYLGKGLAIGVLSLALGFLGGLMLAGVLIFVINRAYFGWTIQVYFSWLSILAQFLVILAGAVLASVYPAFRASGTPATELSRDDL